MDPLVSIVSFAAFAVVLAAGIIIFRSARKKTVGVTYSPIVVATPTVPKTEQVKPSEPVSDAASQTSYLKVGRRLADWVNARHKEKVKE